ncbi:hypothetical protein HJG60_009560 [Phyllostomus discolor]|uniref:Uncharacterized protein n=1 Tax=Phyllostomus discolor TaxID=89673 RepID=A0A834DAY8_9CHIR|nr:hypothetical protein HJG60_009560 [Phyllostomus discolor]
MWISEVSSMTSLERSFQKVRLAFRRQKSADPSLWPQPSATPFTGICRGVCPGHGSSPSLTWALPAVESPPCTVRSLGPSAQGIKADPKGGTCRHTQRWREAACPPVSVAGDTSREMGGAQTVDQPFQCPASPG